MIINGTMAGRRLISAARVLKDNKVSPCTDADGDEYYRLTFTDDFGASKSAKIYINGEERVVEE